MKEEKQVKAVEPPRKISKGVPWRDTDIEAIEPKSIGELWRCPDGTGSIRLGHWGILVEFHDNDTRVYPFSLDGFCWMLCHPWIDYADTVSLVRLSPPPPGVSKPFIHPENKSLPYVLPGGPTESEDWMPSFGDYLIRIPTEKPKNPIVSRMGSGIREKGTVLVPFTLESVYLAISRIDNWEEWTFRMFVRAGGYSEHTLAAWGMTPQEGSKDE